MRRRQKSIPLRLGCADKDGPDGPGHRWVNCDHVGFCNARSLRRREHMAYLSDGRTLRVQLAWFPRLLAASPEHAKYVPASRTPL